jgi:hypothetical protein
MYVQLLVTETEKDFQRESMSTHKQHDLQQARWRPENKLLVNKTINKCTLIIKQ